MQKKKLKLKKTSRVNEVTYSDENKNQVVFDVVNHIPLAAQFILANTYLDAYFNSAIENIEEMFISEWDYIGAENALILVIIDDFTSISIVDGNDKISIDIDDIVRSGIWDLIKSSIKNYEEFRKCLDVMVEDAKREILSKRSVGHVIDSLADRAMSLISSLAELDLSEEGIKQIMDSIGNLSEQLEDSPIGSLLEESKKHKV